jgi:putative transposase
MEIARTSSCVYKIRYHLVTAVKYRKLLLNPAVVSCVRDALASIAQRYDIVFDEVGFDGDHVHIFCGAKPSFSPLRVISIIKSITARQVFAGFPTLRRTELWGGEFWSDGKYIGTVGDATNELTIRKYIQNQGIPKPKSEQRMQQLKLFKL